MAPIASTRPAGPARTNGLPGSSAPRGRGLASLQLAIMALFGCRCFKSSWYRHWHLAAEWANEGRRRPSSVEPKMGKRKRDIDTNGKVIPNPSGSMRRKDRNSATTSHRAYVNVLLSSSKVHLNLLRKMAQAHSAQTLFGRCKYRSHTEATQNYIVTSLDQHNIRERLPAVTVA